MLTKDVDVTLTIRVTVDESKFTDQFMSEFCQSFYHFTTLNDHLEHLAQMHARGLYGERDFIEGYGPAADMGIKLKIVDQNEEVREIAA